ncbi:checkpoint 9-1-1 complex, RAD9 component [Moesziomyces antarcticus T-34]|uniref:non-specific serine/threonine protein kinase n=1 Tax=Pseudozyma antarctica (strain T-34) TaxID=1151754 RepID=M9LZD6_PSEA3|nr:checkpoint 9-1-1 complex, RAD9 component [Moesziomyces antarcticus T-34]
MKRHPLAAKLLRQEEQRDLFERIRPECLALQIIFALHYLHTSQKLRRAILHRDLKPENILIHHSGIAKVSDFGLACVIHRGTKARLGIAGTPGFRSPEMLNGLPYGTATDVWSLGNLLWELFTGMPLHRELETGTSKYNVRINVRSGKGVFPLRSAIDSMLSRMDDARPSTNDLLSDATILECLFNLWRTESGRSLEPDSCLDKGVPLPSRVQHAVDHASGQRQRYDTAVASLVAEDSDTSPGSTTTVFRFRHIKLG